MISACGHFLALSRGAVHGFRRRGASQASVRGQTRGRRPGLVSSRAGQYDVIMKLDSDFHWRLCIDFSVTLVRRLASSCSPQGQEEAASHIYPASSSLPPQASGRKPLNGADYKAVRPRNPPLILAIPQSLARFWPSWTTRHGGAGDDNSWCRVQPALLLGVLDDSAGVYTRGACMNNHPFSSASGDTPAQSTARHPRAARSTGCSSST